MAKEKFDIIQSTCIPIEIDNCNTDLIIAMPSCTTYVSMPMANR